MKLVWIFVFLVPWVKPGVADDRLWVAARINGKPACLIFDTGLSQTAVVKRSADRLGLNCMWVPMGPVSVSNAPNPGITEETLLELGSAHLKTWFQVMELPVYADSNGDGFLAWKALDVDLLQIDADDSIVKPITKLPTDLAAWQRLKLLGGAEVLVLEVFEKDGRPGYVYLDTGAESGVNLNPSAWQQWRAAHTNQPANLESYYAADAGFGIMEQVWAEHLALGSITLTGVPVSEANAAQVAQGASGYEATLGMAALRRLDLIIDRPHGYAYVRSKTTAARPYDHNRFGAAIEPKDSGETLIARVLKHSPADEAGLRVGDKLLKVGNRDVSNWHNATFSETSHLPAGTKVEVVLERNGAKLTTTVVLRDLLGQTHGSLNRSRPGPPPERTNDFNAFKGAIRLRPPDAGDYDRRAFVYESNGRLDEAISNYSRAIQLDSSLDEAYSFRGRCYARKGEFEKTIADSKSAISIQPTNELAWFNLGYAYSQQTNWDGAITAYREAVRLNPANAQNYHYRGIAYEAKGAAKEALDDYSEAIRLDPKDATACLMRGRRYYLDGDLNQAILDLSKVIELKPASVEAYQGRAYAYAQRGELYLAVNDLTEVIRLQPTNAWAYETRGNAYTHRRDWEKSIHDYTEALRLDPKDAAALTGRGIAYLEKRDFEQADSDFKQSVILNPQDPSTYRNVAWLEATCPDDSVRNGAAAVEAGKKACELTRWKDAGALTVLAAASAEVGDFENAVKYEQQGLALDDLSEQERKKMGERLLLYQQHKPFHLPGGR